MAIVGAFGTGASGSGFAVGSYDVVAWYKRNGYHFLALTDHDTLTDPAGLDTNPNDDFVLLGGEEITNRLTVHVNGIGITRAILEGKPRTPFLRFGDRVRIEMLDEAGRSIFGAIDQPVVHYAR